MVFMKYPYLPVFHILFPLETPSKGIIAIQNFQLSLSRCTFREYHNPVFLLRISMKYTVVHRVLRLIGSAKAMLEI